MRIEYIYTCCRCGKEFKGNAKLFGTAKVNVVKYQDYLNKLDYAYKEICPLCFRELKWWLKGNSLSIDEIKRLHQDIDELNRQVDMSKEVILNQNQEIKKLEGEVYSLNDRLEWFTEEVDTPNGKATVSKDLKKLKEAKEYLKWFLYEADPTRDIDGDYDKKCKQIEQFIIDNFPNENLKE